MNNVTISMKDELVQFTRVEAAKAGKSMSRYFADLIEAARHGRIDHPPGGNIQLEALERSISGPKLPISEDGRMPTAEERNARR